MEPEKIRLGGMALQAGVLRDGPRGWAAPIRPPERRPEVGAAPKRLRAAEVEQPFLRGPARLFEALAILPELRRRLPAAKLPFERPGVLAAMLGSAVVVRAVRGSEKIGPAAQELVGGLLSLAPAALALRSSELAGYHGAEHVSIGTYEQDETHAKEHERCGSHLVGPFVATSALASALAARAPANVRLPAKIGASLGALAGPGHELQHRLATAEPTPEQLEVAEAALRACLALEHGNHGTD